jgi:hypothetical protein
MKVALTARFWLQMIVALTGISYHVFFLMSPLGHQQPSAVTAMKVSFGPQADITA